MVLARLGVLSRAKDLLRKSQGRVQLLLVDNRLLLHDKPTFCILLFVNEARLGWIKMTCLILFMSESGFFTAKP